MNPKEMTRPPLPRAWYRPTFLGFLCYLLSAFAWIPVFGYVSMRILGSQLPLGAKIALLVPSIILTGHGFHMIAWFAHDGVHLSLIKNKYWSSLIGCIAGGAALFPTLGYAITHWNHHRFTNQESDPDAKIYPQYKTFWPRLLFGRVTANRGYLRNSWCIAFNKPLDKGYRIPFSDDWLRIFAIVTLVSLAGWLSFYLSFLFVDPTYFLVGLFLPFLTVAPLTGLRIYMEHNGTGAGIFRDTRSYVSPFWTVVMFGNNFHLEHHLYPTVPAYHLPKVHRLLAGGGYYERYGSHVAHGVLEPLKYLSGKYQYPEAQLEDLQADPFQPQELEGGSGGKEEPAGQPSASAAH